MSQTDGLIYNPDYVGHLRYSIDKIQDFILQLGHFDVFNRLYHTLTTPASDAPHEQMREFSEALYEITIQLSFTATYNSMIAALTGAASLSILFSTPLAPALSMTAIASLATLDAATAGINLGLAKAAITLEDAPKQDWRAFLITATVFTLSMPLIAVTTSVYAALQLTTAILTGVMYAATKCIMMTTALSGAEPNPQCSSPPSSTFR